MSKIISEDIVTVIKGLEWNIDADKLLFDKDLYLQNVDSLDLMSLLFALEEKYNIEIGDESLEQKEWSSIDKIANQINSIIECMKPNNG